MTVSRPFVARLRRAAGFTLIELMVVLVIIGVLAADGRELRLEMPPLAARSSAGDAVAPPVRPPVPGQLGGTPLPPPSPSPVRPPIMPPGAALPGPTPMAPQPFVPPQATANN